MNAYIERESRAVSFYNLKKGQNKIQDRNVMAAVNLYWVLSNE